MQQTVQHTYTSQLISTTKQLINLPSILFYSHFVLLERREKCTGKIYITSVRCKGRETGNENEKMKIAGVLINEKIDQSREEKMMQGMNEL